MPLSDVMEASSRTTPLSRPALSVNISEEADRASSGQEIWDGSIPYGPLSHGEGCEAPDTRDCSDELAHATTTLVPVSPANRSALPCGVYSNSFRPQSNSNISVGEVSTVSNFTSSSRSSLPDGEIDVDISPAAGASRTASPHDSPNWSLSNQPMQSPLFRVPCSEPAYRRHSRRKSTAETYREPEQTLIALDWDDTLMPASWLRGQGLAATLTPVRSSEHSEELQMLDSAICDLLATASLVSRRVIILTNANRPWVTDSAQTYLPKVAALLHQENAPTIVYAREYLQKKMRIPATPVRWRDQRSTQEELDALLTMAKIFALKQELRRFYSQYPGQSWKNVLSVGDALHEIHAVQEVCFMHDANPDKRLRSKAIKLKSAPAVSEMTLQANQLEKYLRQVVFHDGDIDVGIEVLEEALHSGHSGDSVH